MNLRTLNDVFFVLMERNSDRVMLTQAGGQWQPISATQLRSWVYATARQLQAWGVNKGERVILLSENRPEWAVVDCSAAGSSRAHRADRGNRFAHQVGIDSVIDALTLQVGRVPFAIPRK